MNLCEKSGVLTNVYAGFCCVEKDADFREVKKVFVLQAWVCVSVGELGAEVN